MRIKPSESKIHVYKKKYRYSLDIFIPIFIVDEIYICRWNWYFQAAPQNPTFNCFASWSFNPAAQSAILMCSLKAEGQLLNEERKWKWKGQLLKWKRNRHFANSEVQLLLFCSLLFFFIWKKTHFAERKRTMESNFSFLLNCAASPDNLVHTWRVSGSNWVSVSWTTKKVSASNFVNLFQIHMTGENNISLGLNWILKFTIKDALTFSLWGTTW